MAVYGYVLLDSYMTGSDLGAAITNAFNALGTAGGTIDARNVNVSGFTFQTKVTLDKPVTLLLGPGNYAAGGASPPSPIFLVTVNTTNGTVGNLSVIGMDPSASTITAANNGTIFQLKGDFFDYAGDGKPFFTLKNLTLNGLSGTSCMLDAGSNVYPNLNFQDGLILVEDCTITNFGSANGAIWLGRSVYFSRIHRNEFINNNAAIYLDNNTESAITENYFSQSATAGYPTITSIGPMHRIVNNYFYRFSIASLSTAPDILLSPQAAWSSQSGGYVWILDNRFGGERENFDTRRYRIRLYASPTTIIAGPAIVKGNQFFGPACAVALVAASGGTATVTLSTANGGTPTTGLQVGSVVTITGIPSALAQFNGTFTLTGTVTATTFQFALAGTVSSTNPNGGLVTLANGAAISLENPSLPWDLSGNYFAQYAVLVNDAQPTSGTGFGLSMFLDNRVGRHPAGYKVFANEGREFASARLPADAALVPWSTDARFNETRSLRNRLPASEALDTWNKNGSGNNPGVQGSQPDPYGTSRAFLVTLGGTSSSQWVGQIFYSADLAQYSRVVVKFWAKAGTLSSVTVGVFDSITQQFTGDFYTFSLGSDWKQYKFVSNGIPTAGDTYELLFYPGDANLLSGTVYLFGPQVSDVDSDYLPNTNSKTTIAKVDDTSAGNRMERALVVPFVKTSQLGYSGPALSGSGLGSNPTLAVDAGATDMAGVISVTPGSGVTWPASVTLTYNVPAAANPPVVVALLQDTGTAWPSGTSLRLTATSTTSFTLSWSTTLASGSTYKISYMVIGR
jgi:hypothetical protein